MARTSLLVLVLITFCSAAKLNAQPTPPGAGQPFLSNASSVFSGSGWVNDARLADFNGDGKLDIAAIYVLDPSVYPYNYSANGLVRVYLGDGRGGYTLVRTYAVGNNPWSIATGDFNGDSRIDMAICNDGAANSQPDSITVLLGDGTGGFSPAPGSPIALPSHSGPLSLAVTDFNRDGKLDLVSANAHNRTVTVFLGNGNGTFTVAPGSPVPVPVQPWTAAVCDLNGDGKVDVVVGSYDGGLMIMLGDGTGRLTATPASPLPAGMLPKRIALGDFNGDGKPDIVVANEAVVTTWPDYGNVTVLLGNGDGTFRSSGNGQFAVGRFVIDVAVADFNQDGKLDIAALSFMNDTTTILLGDGAGHFTAAPGSPYSVSVMPSRLAVGDIDGDGTPDILAASGSISLNIIKPPILSVTHRHTGDFMLGQPGTYTIVISNQPGAGPTRQLTTVTETLPTGLWLNSMSGPGWTCNLNQCTRADTLTNNGSYPPITVVVSTNYTTPTQVSPVVTVESVSAATVTATDPTIVNRISQAILFDPLPSRTYGSYPFTVGAIATSGLPVFFSAGPPSVCNLIGATVAITGAGTCGITASQSGSAIYAVAAPVVQSFQVHRALLAVTADPKTFTYGVSPTYSARLAGFVNGDTAASVSGSPAFTINATTRNGNPNAGTWTITPARGTLATPNYSFTFVTATLTVTPVPLTVTANSASKVYGAPVPPLTASFSGFVNLDSASALTGTTSLTTSANATSPTGAYTIEAAAGTLASANYTFGFVNGTLTVAKASTTTVLTETGNGVTASVIPVAPGAGTPTGTIQIFKGTTSLGLFPLAPRPASYPTGDGTISVIYSGDSNFLGSTSNSVVIYPPRTTELTVFGTPNYSTLGQAVILKALLDFDGGPPGSPRPTGLVRFSAGGRMLGSGVLSGSQAFLTTTALTGGYHTIVAEYSGDGVWPAASATCVVTVTANVTLTPKVTPDRTVFGQPVTLTVEVGATVPAGFAAPTGDVTFTLPGYSLFAPPVVLGTAPVIAGAATLTLSTLPVGTQTVTGRYNGDTTWTPFSCYFPVTIAQASTASTLSLAPAGDQLLLTGSVVVVAPGSGTPTGSVDFTDTSTHTIVGTADLSKGTGTFSVPADSVSSVLGHPIVAVYSGDTSFQTSTSVPLPTIANAALPSATTLAPEAIASLFGMTHASGDSTAETPLPTSLEGVNVKITDQDGTTRPAPLYGVFGSSGQINLVIPAGTVPGLASVTVAFHDSTTIQTAIAIANVAPGMFTADGLGQGPYAGQQIYVGPDGEETVSRSYLIDSAGGGFAPNPIRLGGSGSSVYLVLYGTGIRSAVSVTATINGVNVPVVYHGPRETSPGLDQIKLGPLPLALAGTGSVTIALTADGKQANPVTAAIQ